MVGRRGHRAEPLSLESTQILDRIDPETNVDTISSLDPDTQTIHLQHEHVTISQPPTILAPAMSSSGLTPTWDNALSQSFLQAPYMDTENNINIQPNYRNSSSKNPSFYGPTSQPFLQFPCAEAEMASPGLDSDADPLMNIDSSYVRKPILDSYWKSNEVWSYVVDRELFTTSKTMGSTKYYSVALEDAMLACGSRNSTSSAIRKLGRKLVSRAKARLSTELERPTITSIQTCLLVSNFESGAGRSQAGWTYCGTTQNCTYFVS
jgi:hypothetical protein